MTAAHKQSEQNGSTRKIIAFPRYNIAYNECLYEAVLRLGVSVMAGQWSGRWLKANVNPGDIIHLHWPSFLYYDANSLRRTLHGVFRFVLLYTIIKLRGGRFVWTAHNLYPHDGGRREWSHRFIRRFVARAADAILAHSPSAVSILKAEFDIKDRQIVEIPHGNWIGYHPWTLTKAEARRALDIPENTFLYSFIGACKPYKNLEALITAFRRLDGNCFLLITGQFQFQDYKAKIDALLAEQPTARIRVVPHFVANDDMQKYLVAADALVFPYTDILTSGSAMLGLSFGVPVIVPQIGSMADVITPDCGLLYDQTAPEGLFEAMSKIRSKSYSPQTILECGRKYDWNVSARILAKLLAAD